MRMQPFTRTTNRTSSKVTKEVLKVLSDKQAKSIALLLAVNFFCTIWLIAVATSSNSMALSAFSYISIFDFLCLCTCLLSMWISKQTFSDNYSFGYDRFEILAVFICTTLTQLGAFFILKESVERIFQRQNVMTDGQLTVTLCGLAVHLIVIYGVNNKPFSQVSSVASSNWLQDTVQDLGKNVCGMAPTLSKYLIPRFNPYALLGVFSALVVASEIILVEERKSSMPDTICAIVIAFCTCITMFPLGVYSGMILLQATPAHLIDNLDTLIREANTLDGVLEIRNEHFWNIGFEKVAGSFHVRVSRDAEEQMILAEITHRLTPFLNQITIQIYKDDRSLPKSGYVALTLPTKQTTSGIESPLYDDFQFKNISIESNRR